jgi:hypothetical protein
MSEFETYQQLILRLPDRLAEKMTNILNRSSEKVHLEVIPEGSNLIYRRGSNFIR